MLKTIRRLAIGVVILLIIILGYRYVSQWKNQQAYNQLKKNLFVSKTQSKQAPTFSLTDQKGNEVSLSQFKGKKVVLQFMDPKCTDICPLVSKEIIQANQLLGDGAKQVVYVAVNVNEYHNTQKDVMAFSKQHGLSALKNWYFLTGSASQLRKVWSNYGVSVIPSKDGDVQHTSVLYFLNKQGKETYMGQPENDKTSVKEWAKGISFLLEKS